jgi:hypothetical protein
MVTLAATQINAPWKGWRILMPGFLRRFLGKLWLFMLVLFAITLLGSMFAAIFGFIPLFSSLFTLTASDMTGFLYSLAYFMLVLLPLTILAGLAHDLERVDFSK